jgi:hypothetical protein
VSAITPQQIRFSRKLRSAVDVFLIAHGVPSTHERRMRVFDVLTEDDPDREPGDLGRMLDEFPPATFDLDQLPVPLFPGNPQSN